MTSFAEQLHAALADPSVECLQWRPHGRCFEVVSREQLEQTVLRPIFRLDLIEEFEMRLTEHGVYRIRTGRDSGCYYHDVSGPTHKE